MQRQLQQIRTELSGINRRGTDTTNHVNVLGTQLEETTQNMQAEVSRIQTLMGRVEANQLGIRKDVDGIQIRLKALQGAPPPTTNVRSSVNTDAIQARLKRVEQILGEKPWKRPRINRMFVECSTPDLVPIHQD
jgi:hypothetical protein